jgi:hypothetical protein
MDTVLSLAWKRVSTMTRLCTAAGIQDVSIDPNQLNAALGRDQLLPDTQSSEAATPSMGLISRTRKT